jgi:DNA-binding HxlR family transcriptional regulator
MSHDGYLNFCPIAKACEIIEPRWTLLVLCELFSGATRFNEIRRGLPTMSPTLLSRRLKEMEQRGLVTRTQNPRTGEIDYRTTRIADELQPVAVALGKWAHRNVDAEVTMEHLDSRLLMWNLGRRVDVSAMPPTATNVIEFIFPDLHDQNNQFWIVVRRDRPVDVCLTDPGLDVDLCVQADLKAMTSVFLGYTSLRAEVGRGKINLVGDRRLAQSIANWLVITSFAAA